MKLILLLHSNFIYNNHVVKNPTLTLIFYYNLEYWYMTEVFFQELKEELQKSLVQKKHPFRYFTLATLGLEKIPRLRTVVLRKITEELMLTFYTDKRSKKIMHLKENNKVSL